MPDTQSTGRPAGRNATRAPWALRLAALLLLAGCSTSVKLGPEAVAGLTPDGTVEMNEVQVAYIGSAGGGNGTLYYRGGRIRSRSAASASGASALRRSVRKARSTS